MRTSVRSMPISLEVPSVHNSTVVRLWVRKALQVLEEVEAVGRDEELLIPILVGPVSPPPWLREDALDETVHEEDVIAVQTRHRVVDADDEVPIGGVCIVKLCDEVAERDEAAFALT